MPRAAFLHAIREGTRGEVPSTADLVRRITELESGGSGVAPIAAAPVAQPPVTAPAPIAVQVAPTHVADGVRRLEIRVGPLERPEQADAIQELFRDIPGLGDIKSLSSDRKDTRVFAVETTSTDEDLLDLFAFHVSEHIAIKGPIHPQ